MTNQSITELGKDIPASKSSVLRFVQKLGFEGFSEFKFSLKQDMQKKGEQEVGDIFEAQALDIKRTQHLLEVTDFSEIVTKIFSAKHIYCFGTGYSQRTVIKEWSKQMMYLGKWVIHLLSKTEFDAAIQMIEQGDLVILVSLSGETEEVKENISNLRLRGIEILAITQVGDNYFSKMSNYAMSYYTTAFQVGHDNRSFNSLITLGVLMDTLFRKCGEYYENYSK